MYGKCPVNPDSRGRVFLDLHANSSFSQERTLGITAELGQHQIFLKALSSQGWPSEEAFTNLLPAHHTSCPSIDSTSQKAAKDNSSGLPLLPLARSFVQAP